MTKLNWISCGIICSVAVTGCSGSDGKDGKAANCTVEADGGVATVACSDGTTVTVTDGHDGATGPAGKNGEQGPAGDAGVIGPAGATGATGATGAGTTGAAGPVGATGATGPAGDTGTTGPAGGTGATGPAGDTGAIGPAGDTGATGPIGSTGATGPAGDAGLTGATGPLGAMAQRNPYDGAKGYVNPEWADKVASAALTANPTLAVKMNAIANTSTAVWFSNIASIVGAGGRMGLREHLDLALSEAQSAQKTIVFTMVLNNLPNRNCISKVSHGELSVASGGIETYKTQYIDAIKGILADSKYSSLRISVIIEPDSIVNLVTNVGLTGSDATPLCDEAASSGAYATDIQYSINQLHALPNVYLFADIARSGRLGWELLRSPSKAVSIYFDTLSHTDFGVYGIDGLVSNISDYIPTLEPFMPNPNLYVGVPNVWDGITGGPIKSAAFYNWNDFLDENSYARQFRESLIEAGFPSSLTCLIDTGRNGWGGPSRPAQLTAPSDLSTVDPVTYVANNKVDQRSERWHWCNQNGAGLGERPRIWPAADIAAYVWVKPPGESDGTDDTSAVSDPSLADEMCSPSNGAIPGAPAYGGWFEAQFEQLVENAYPPIH